MAYQTRNPIVDVAQDQMMMNTKQLSAHVSRMNTQPQMHIESPRSEDLRACPHT